MKLKRWGVSSAFGDLNTVLMHRPGPELRVVTESNLREFNFDEPVDVGRFCQDYDIMVQCFEDHGVDVLFLTDVLADDSDALNYISHRPNMTYVRDLARVFRKGAILMSPHLRGRWGDQQMLGRAFDRLGIPVHGEISCPAFLEGGGVTMIGEDTVVASICDRANQSGTAALRELVLGTEARHFLDVPLPFGHIHIDGLFMMLDENLAICHTETFEVFPCALYEVNKKTPRYLLFTQFLEERGIEIIPISSEEMRRGDLNVVVTRRGRKAVGFSSAKRLADEMAARGWELTMFPRDTLFKGNGGAHCMTCPIHVA